MTKLDSILKSKDITLPTKVCLVKAMVFPIVMSGCESWTIKKAEHWRIDAFELWCWRRLLRVSWTASRSNQSILKEISPECSLEGLMLKLKCQYFGHLMRRTDSLEKTLMLGRIEGGRRKGWQRVRWLDGITNSMDMSLSNSGSCWWTGRPGVLQSMWSQRVGHDWVTELNWRTQSQQFFPEVHMDSALLGFVPDPLFKSAHYHWPDAQTSFKAIMVLAGWCWCQHRIEPKESKMSKGWGHQGCHMELWAAVLVPITQPCLTLGDPVDCSPPASSIHGILQARILGCVQHNLHVNDKTIAWI